MREPTTHNDPASFRDPSGFVFYHDGRIVRQVNSSFKQHFDTLLGSGLYEELTDQGLLIAHEETTSIPAQSSEAYKLILPEKVPFVSYPYEWSFSQLKDAALLTLELQRRALNHGMELRDSSAYNIQFVHGRPIMIDTLSFALYREGQPWVAYRQFCQHFAAPLALMAHSDVRLNQLLRVFIDGIPLDMASRLLPFRTKLGLSLGLHIHAHARAQRKYANIAEAERTPSTRSMSRNALHGLIDSLTTTIRKLEWKPEGTEWADYYDQTNYSEQDLEAKKGIIESFVTRVRPRTAWDLGANVGLFSRILSNAGVETVAFDIDPAAVEQNYLQCKSRGEQKLLPLIADLTNPSPGIGWAGKERRSLPDRGPVDLAMALALIHHLAISNNLPFDRISAFLRDMCAWLIIEFVPKSDSQVQRLLSSREDIFDRYSMELFEQVFAKDFEIPESMPIGESGRVLFLMKNRKEPAGPDSARSGIPGRR